MARAKLILTLVLASGTALAAVRSGTPASKGDVLQLGARLNSLERELGQQNNKYLAAIQKIHDLEAELDIQVAKLNATKEEQTKREEELAQILRSYHLAVVEGDAIPTPQYLDLVKQNREKARTKIQETEELSKNITAYQERLATLKNDEQGLLKLTADLEIRKKGLTEVYLSKLEERQRTDAKAQAQRIQERVRVVTRPVIPAADVPSDQRFAPPLDEFTSATPSDKGVTYKFTKLQPIKAPRAGRVVYNGDLASYGKVLMIDHGDDVRTVMLGRFTSRLQKNTQVNIGETLGYTEEGDSLYFEVRKKNVAQNTINWMGPVAVGKI